MLESRLMLEGENGMFTGVAVEFTCPNAALPRAHDAPATVGLLADVSHSKRCERVRHRKRRLRASGAPVGLPVDGRSDGWLIGNGRVLSSRRARRTAPHALVAGTAFAPWVFATDL